MGTTLGKMTEFPRGCNRFYLSVTYAPGGIDCDCRAIGYCPAGPPPPPPIWEFLDLKPNEEIPVPRPDATSVPYLEDWDFYGKDDWVQKGFGKDEDVWIGSPEEEEDEEAEADAAAKKKPNLEEEETESRLQNTISGANSANAGDPW